MGYSLSIRCSSQQERAKLDAWVKSHVKMLDQLPGSPASLRNYVASARYCGDRHPAYAPKGNFIGFDYGPGWSLERFYVWELANLLAKRAGKRFFYYDEEAIAVHELPEWEKLSGTTRMELFMALSPWTLLHKLLKRREKEPKEVAWVLSEIKRLWAMQ